MKKFFAALLALIMMCSMFAACNNVGPSADDFVIPEGGYDGSHVKIKFSHTMGQNLRDVLDAYIVEFNKLYPNIEVEHEQIGGYDDVRDQVNTELSAGNEPNIAYCYPDHVAGYKLTRRVVTLDQFIDSKLEVARADGSKEILGLTDAQKADFVESYYEEGRQFGDGHMYTLPFSKSTEVLYYNKTFFDENNLSLPTTWDEMEALCARILEIDPTCYPLGYDSEANWFITMCEQLGTPYTSATGKHFLFDNKENKAFVKRFSGWYDKSYVTTQKLYGSYTSGLFVNQDASTPRSYMSIGSSAGATHQRPSKVNVTKLDEEGNPIPKLDKDGNPVVDADGKPVYEEEQVYPFEVGITSIPQVNPSNPKVISQGPNVCIFTKEDPQEVIASWLFVKFLTTSVEFQAEFGMASGYVPVLKSVASNPVYAEFMASANGYDYVAAYSAKVCLDQVSAYYTSPAFFGSSDARSQVQNLFVACLPEKADDAAYDSFADNAFKKAVDECEYAIS